MCQSVKTDNQKHAGVIQQSTAKDPNEMLDIGSYGSPTMKSWEKWIPAGSGGLIYALGWLLPITNIYSLSSSEIPVEGKLYKMGRT